MFPIACTSSSDISFLLFHASLVLYLEAHEIPDLPVSYENSNWSLGPICQTPSFLPCTAGDTDCEEVAEVGPLFTIYFLGRLRMNYLCPRCPNLCSINCAAGYPCRFRGEVGLCLFFLSLLGPPCQSTHSCFSWWWGGRGKE